MQRDERITSTAITSTAITSTAQTELPITPVITSPAQSELPIAPVITSTAQAISPTKPIGLNGEKIILNFKNDEDFLNIIPKEIVHAVLIYLNIKDLATFAKVCKTMHELMDSVIVIQERIAITDAEKLALYPYYPTQAIVSVQTGRETYTNICLRLNQERNRVNQLKTITHLNASRDNVQNYYTDLYHRERPIKCHTWPLVCAILTLLVAGLNAWFIFKIVDTSRTIYDKDRCANIYPETFNKTTDTSCTVSEPGYAVGTGLGFTVLPAIVVLLVCLSCKLNIREKLNIPKSEWQAKIPYPDELDLLESNAHLTDTAKKSLNELKTEYSKLDKKTVTGLPIDNMDHSKLKKHTINLVVDYNKLIADVTSSIQPVSSFTPISIFKEPQNNELAITVLEKDQDNSDTDSEEDHEENGIRMKRLDV